MKLAMFAVVAVLALGLGGCGVLEPAFGIQTDPETGEKSADGTGGIVGTGVGFVFPWAPTILGILTAAYASARAKQWKAAGMSTMQAIEAFKETPEGVAAWASLKTKLGESQAAAKVQEFINAQLKKLHG